MNGVDSLALTKLDTLSGYAQLKVCTAYPDDGLPEVAYGRALALFQLG